ncbi:MAG TPA: AAA family ATPase [Lachnospiraceae bacterium]|nr:AAA family ATPase [Lachnospiraceae bacterium]
MGGAESKERKVISIGMEDFREIIDKNGYFVDKTQMIQKLLDSNSKATLFTRPRRFGKTLNLSMIRRFFEDERKPDGTAVDNSHLFDGLAISKCGEKYLRHMGKYPVINLSLKSGKQPDFETAYASLKDEITREFQRHSYILAGEMSERERETFESILRGKAENIQYAKGLQILSDCLVGYHGRKCIILIDEYDVPLENARFCEFYGQMIGFIRSLFESALKTNDSLEFGVITGCLRISRESIFTGLNNLAVNTMLGPDFGDSFGFTDGEVEAMLKYYGRSEKLEEIRTWYDGYCFGDREIYNPWSILNYVKNAGYDPKTFPKAYWGNTSSNSIVKELIEDGSESIRGEIEALIAGGYLEKPLHEEITYGDIHESEDNLWNFLYFTGYLTSCGQRYDGETIFVKMRIPNTEIRTIYKNTVLSWFDKKIRAEDRTPLVKAIEDGDCTAIEAFINRQLQETISFFDYQESYYHGFLTGLLKGNRGYLVASNRENGLGRTDITLRENRFRGRAVILEIKITMDFRKMEELCREALEQIETNHYEDNLVSDGYGPILKYGICFFKKGCMVMKA